MVYGSIAQSGFVHPTDIFCKESSHRKVLGSNPSTPTLKNYKYYNAVFVSMSIKHPQLTIILAIAVLVSFLLFSSMTLFSTQEAIENYGFSVFKPWNILFFNFVHTGFTHLLANLAMIVAAGLVLERYVRTKKIIALFFVGAGISAILFVLINPSFAVVGSSAGAVALLTAAIAIDPKKTFAYLIILFVASNVIVFGLNYQIESQQKTIVEEVQRLEVERRIAIEQGDLELAEITVAKITVKKETQKQIEKGVELTKIPVNFEIHLFASLIGALYVFFFERKLFKRTAHNELKFILNLFQRN